MNEKPKKKIPKALKVVLYIILSIVILFAALFIWAVVDVIRNPQEKTPTMETVQSVEKAAATSTPEPTTEPTLEPTPEPTPDPTSSPIPTPTAVPGLSISECAKLSESIMKQNYGDGYSIQIDGNVVTYNIWRDGIAAGAILASSGAQEYKKLWDDMIAGTGSMASSVQKYFDETCSDSVVVAVNIVNDANKENVLATYLAGVVMYDSVNGINLLG